jgi:hypothetical protein
MLHSVLIILAAGTIPADSEAIRFKADSALVSDALGRPLFRAGPDYLFPLAGNPGGKVVRYDSARRRVLVSAAAPEWWVDCEDLQPTGETCAPLRRRGANRAAADTPPSLDLGRGVPSCPGDPRCPRRD